MSCALDLSDYFLEVKMVLCHPNSHGWSVVIDLLLIFSLENPKKRGKGLRRPACLWRVCPLPARLWERPETGGEKHQQEECRFVAEQKFVSDVGNCEFYIYCVVSFVFKAVLTSGNSFSPFGTLVCTFLHNMQKRPWKGISIHLVNCLQSWIVA